MVSYSPHELYRVLRKQAQSRDQSRQSVGQWSNPHWIHLLCDQASVFICGFQSRSAVDLGCYHKVVFGRPLSHTAQSVVIAPEPPPPERLHRSLSQWLNSLVALEIGSVAIRTAPPPLPGSVCWASAVELSQLYSTQKSVVIAAGTWEPTSRSLSQTNRYCCRD